MKKIIIGYCLLLSITTGCVPVLIGGVIYKSSKSKGQHQEFITQFQKTNMEREEYHLKPLNWCSEAYRFDPSWAKKDQRCAGRIKAYERGEAESIDKVSTE